MLASSSLKIRTDSINTSSKKLVTELYSTASASIDSSNKTGPMEGVKNWFRKQPFYIPHKTIKKLLPLGAMFFCILFNYTILRDTKDVLVVTTAGAEIIPFLKTYVQLPAAIGFTVIYAAMCNKMTNDKVFYAIVAPFLAFFGLFAGVIYPNRLALHPHATADWLLTVTPKFIAPLIAIFRNWTYALFYCMAELWGSIVVSLLFWGFSNEICSTAEAKKYYPLFGLMANVALIFSGQYVTFVSSIRASLPAGVDKWGYSLKLLMSAVVASGSVMLGLFTYMQKSVLTDPACVSATKQIKKKTKTDMGVVDSAKFLAKSPYIRDLATLVVGYGMAINIVEVTWKSKLKAAFPDPNAYSSFMGNFSSATGTVTLLMMLAGSKIFEKFGWGVAAIIPPITLLVTGVIFFGLILAPATFAPLAAACGTSPLMLAVYVGALQNIFSKGSKYALFDPCKEMAYIPLDAESKTKGKAAVDVIGNPLGKSGGSFIQQILIGYLGSLSACTPYLGGILGGVIVMWINATRSLNTQYIAITKKQDAEEAAAAAQIVNA